MNIENKLILITGASSGIGENLSLLASAAGARILLIARNEEKLAKIKDKIQQKGGFAEIFVVDLSVLQETLAVIEQIKSEYGIPDIIINSAGAGRWLKVSETPFEEIQQMMAVPYLAAFYMVRGFIHKMIERNSGYIININSPAQEFMWPASTGYLVARRALDAFTIALRAELKPTNIRVMNVGAGKVATPYFENNPGAEERIPRVASILLPTMSAEFIANKILRGIEKNKQKIIAPKLLRLFYALNGLFPFVFTFLLSIGQPKDVPPR
ncbi:MAG: SDR family NAD(P)-dependent oxidoreductase [Candidatus Kariarchaeaceae archaeon]